MSSSESSIKKSSSVKNMDWQSKNRRRIRRSNGRSYKINFNKNRTPEIITQQLIEGIDIIKNATWYPEYNLITEPFESLQTEFDRDLLNKLHHHFELLQGQIWNPASYLGKANGKERFAISKLNLCCHELEAYYDSVEQQKNNKGHHTYFYYSI